MRSRPTRAAVALSIPLAPSPHAYVPLGPAEQSFISDYTGLVLVETVVVLLVVGLVVPRLARAIGEPLLRQVRLGRVARVAAVAALVAGLFLFAFWAALDVVSGYQSFPAWALTRYPVAADIYEDLGLGVLPIPDKYHVVGIFGFLLAGAGFFGLRAGRGVGTAIRDSVAYFAAPIVIAFELAIWVSAPAEMYWHATYFAPWSLGKFLTATQFETVNRTGDLFTWAGNIYIVSNWFALAAACALLGTAILFATLRRLRVEQAPTAPETPLPA